jgi:hypothetical protein
MDDYGYSEQWEAEVVIRERRRLYCIECGSKRLLPYINDYQVWLFSTPTYVCENCITLKELAE